LAISRYKMVTNSTLHLIASRSVKSKWTI